MRAERHVATFGAADGELLVGGVPLRRLADARRVDPVLRLRPGPLTRRGSRSCAPRCPSDCTSATPSRPTRCRRSCSTSRGRSTALDVASAGEMQVALDTGHAADPGQLRRTGQDDRRAACRPSPPGCSSRSSRRARLDRLVRARRASWACDRAAAVRVNPDFAVKGSGMRMGGGPQQFGVDAERRARRCSADVGGPRRRPRWASTSSPGRRTSAPTSSSRRSARTVDLAARLADKAPQPLTVPQPRRGLRHPVLRQGRAARPRRGSAAHLAELLADERACRRCPTPRVVLELGRYLVGEAASTSPAWSTARCRAGRRTSSSTAACTTSSPPRATSARSSAATTRWWSATGSGRGARTAPTWSAACAPRSTCSAATVGLPAVEVGDLVVVFQAGAYGLTASPTGFLGHPPAREVLV